MKRRPFSFRFPMQDVSLSTEQCKPKRLKLSLSPERSAEVRRRLGLPSKSQAKHAALRAAVPAVWILIAKRYPTTFAPFGWAPLAPLKAAIHRDVIAANPKISLPAIRGVLRLYCGSAGYKRLLVEGAARVGLDGLPCGTVTAGEAEHARQAVNVAEAGDARPQ